jgi:hypothetical protein
LERVLKNVYTEPNVQVNSDGTEEVLEPGTETYSRNAVGFSLTGHPTKGSWVTGKVSMGVNQLSITQTGATPLKQTYLVGGELQMAIGLIPPPGKSGLTFEAGYQILSHVSGKEEGNDAKKLKPLTGTGAYVSLGALILLF